MSLQSQEGKASATSADRRVAERLWRGVGLIRRGMADLRGGWKGWVAARFQWWGRRRRRQLEEQAVVSEVMAASEDLQRASASLEKQFLATSESVLELNEQGHQFMRDTERFIDIAIGRSDGKQLIDKGVRVVELPLLFLEQCLFGSERLITHLREDDQSIDELLHAESSLRSTMAPLKFMQILFKIESAPLGDEAQMMFIALTREIERLHTQVVELFDTKFRELRRVQTILAEARAKLEEQSAVLKGFVQVEKTRIENSLRQLHVEIEANQQRDAGIRRLSQGVAQEIKQVVVGLQFQDIINQKLDHIRKAVEEMTGVPGEEAKPPEYLEQACRLEVEQLGAVRQDLARAETMVKTGVTNILKNLSESDANNLSLKEFGQITISAGGMIQVIFEIIDAVRKQVADMVRRTVEIHQHLEPVHGLASGLTTVVRDLSHHIHLIGLNAQVQAAQFSHGGGLEVLSARTSDISNATNRISEDISKHLDEMAVGLSESVRRFDELHLESLAQMLELGSAGAETEEELHKLRDEAIALNLSIGDRLEQIQSRSQETLATVNYVNLTDVVLATLQTRLQRLGAEAFQKLGRQSTKGNEMGDLRAGYTMKSQQQVFDRVVRGRGGVGPTPAAPEAGVAEVKHDDAGDNVELF